MGILSQYQEAVRASHVHALRSVLTDKVTAADLRALLHAHPTLGELSLAEVLSPPTTHQPNKRRTPRAKASKSKPPRKTWSVRTQQGRDALDAAVLEALEDLGGKTVSAPQLNAKLGVTAAQLRTSLNRLIEADRVTYEGRARGTRYSLA